MECSHTAIEKHLPGLDGKGSEVWSMAPKNGGNLVANPI